MKSPFLEKAIARITPDERALMIKSFGIISRINYILAMKDMTQKDLAKKLNVTESTVSKMLYPGKNLTLSTIVKIETALDEKIINVLL